jgi:hypothetical protein
METGALGVSALGACSPNAPTTGAAGATGAGCAAGGDCGGVVAV